VQSELFGTEVAGLVSLHLGLDRPAPAIPNIPWHEHLGREAQLLVDSLASVQERYQAFLPEDALAAIGTLRNNHILRIFRSMPYVVKTDAKQNIQRPVLNIPLEQLQSLMVEIVNSVNKVQREANKLNAAIMPAFPNFTFRDYVRPKMGDARYEGKPGPGVSIGKEPLGSSN